MNLKKKEIKGLLLEFAWKSKRIKKNKKNSTIPGFQSLHVPLKNRKVAEKNSITALEDGVWPSDDAVCVT